MNKKLSLVAFFMFCLMDVLGIYLEKTNDHLYCQAHVDGYLILVLLFK